MPNTFCTAVFAELVPSGILGSIVASTSIVLLEGNLAKTGWIAFMITNFQLSTYLKTDCWKPHKVPHNSI